MPYIALSLHYLYRKTGPRIEEPLFVERPSPQAMQKRQPKRKTCLLLIVRDGNHGPSRCPPASGLRVLSGTLVVGSTPYLPYVFWSTLT
jgi:hypothetical protein